PTARATGALAAIALPASSTRAIRSPAASDGDDRTGRPPASLTRDLRFNAVMSASPQSGQIHLQLGIGMRRKAMPQAVAAGVDIGGFHAHGIFAEIILGLDVRPVDLRG